MIDEMIEDRDPARARFEAAKRASVSQLMMRAARLVNARGLAALREASGYPYRNAHVQLFPHISLEGSRLTEIAEAAGITKQAAQPLVDELEAAGVLERVPDPRDGRAKLVRFAMQDGELSLMRGMRVLAEQDRWLEDRVGAARWPALHEALLTIVDALEEEADAPADS